MESGNKWKVELENEIERAFEKLIKTEICRRQNHVLLALKKALGGSKVDSAFHPSEFDEVTTRNFWDLSGKK